MEAPKWEDIEPCLYADFVCLEELQIDLKKALTELLLERNLRANENGINRVKEVCFKVCGRYPEKIELINNFLKIEF